MCALGWGVGEWYDRMSPHFFVHLSYPMTPPPDQSLVQISVEEFAQLHSSAPESLQLVDVREPQELELAELPGFENLPLSEFAEWSGQIHTRLDAERPILVLCHHGMRSAQMCQWLMSQGFTDVKNIAGGIDAYAARVNPSVPRY
jgi:rhodanese-related sulfurtransferase